MTTHFINNTDLMPLDWRFIEPQWRDPRATWAFFHGVPQNWLEHRVKRPNLARYRAARQAVRAATMRPADSVLVSHLPHLAAATNVLRRRRCPEVRQIAFAFNFTDLPTGRRLAYYRWALKGIDTFVVFSEMERDIYAEAFDLPRDSFHMQHWAMSAPVPGPENPVPFEGPYLSAVGGEGRDYALLAEAMRHLPQVKLAIVARPYSIAGISFPENVTVFTNLPGPQTWRLAQDSIGQVIPLKTDKTACGHVTIVGTQLLNIPLIVTRSSGVADYVSEETATMVTAQNQSDLIDALHAVSTRQEIIQQRCQNALETAQSRNSVDSWVRYFESQLN